MDHLFGWVEDCAQMLDAALALARRGILLDAAAGRARSLLGFVHIFRREFDEAGAQLRRAVTLNPNDVEARGIYGVYLIAIGDAQAALEQFDMPNATTPSRRTG